MFAITTSAAHRGGISMCNKIPRVEEKVKYVKISGAGRTVYVPTANYDELPDF